MCGAIAATSLNTNLLAAGDPLAEVQHEAEDGLAFAQKARFGLVIDIDYDRSLHSSGRCAARPRNSAALTMEHLDELRMERHLSSNPVLALAACWYWIRKLQARFFAGDYTAAVDATSKAQRLLWTSSSLS